ncbi:MAG: RES family NAD+ phosphorylase [Treponema sp.]|nr:RES family NAD+ phosphorylase [Treponema sp.]
MNNEQLEEIMKEAQRVQEQLEKSGALKSIEVMNNNPSIKWAIKEIQNLERSGILKVWQKQFESIGTKTIESLTNISLPVADSIHRELCRLGESTYFQCRHELNALFKNTNVLESINQLRQKIPAYFLYEHQDSKFYNDEIYEVVFQNNEDWKLQINDDTFAISFKKEELTLQGNEIKDVATIEQLFPDFNLSMIVNFISHLRKFPFLSLKSDVGLLIFNRLKEKAENHCIVFESGTLLYRARKIENDEVFSKEEDMLEPITGIPNIGRFNPYGVSTLYLSEDWETAKLELNAEKFQVAEIEIKKSLRVIDLKRSGGLVYKFCNRPLNSKDYNPDEYVLPNFLAQCVSYLKNECGIELDGFEYESTKNKGKCCYALFDVHKPNIQISDICYKKST